MCSDGAGKAVTLTSPLRTPTVSDLHGGGDDSRIVDQVDLPGEGDVLPDLVSKVSKRPISA